MTGSLARRAAAAVALTLLPAALPAQTVRGVVLDGSTTDPVAGATVEVRRTDSTLLASVVSDKRGWFDLDLASEGTYLVRPTHPSYSTAGSDSVHVGRHEIVTLVLRMGRTAIPLEPLVVTARSRNRLSGFYERAEGAGQGRFIHRDFIERRLTARPSQLLRMTPGVRVVPSDDGFSNVITMRGRLFERCAADVFLDGLPVPQSIGMEIDEFTSADQLEGIEIYDAYVTPPPELPLTTNECGVVAFWTRRESHRPFTWKKLGIAVLLGVLLVVGNQMN